MQKYLLIFLFTLISCDINTKRNDSSILTSKQLYDQKCSLCHIAPDVDVLPKNLWIKLLPELGAKMGILEPGFNPFDGLSIEEIDEIIESNYYTNNILVTDNQWEELKDYILKNSPEELFIDKKIKPELKTLKSFNIKRIDLDKKPGSFITFLSYENNNLFYADFFGGFYKYNFQLNESIEYSKFKDPIVWYQELENGHKIFTEIGKLDPTELKVGKLWSEGVNSEKQLIKDELHRPVHTLTYDFDNNGSYEHVISEFGHLTGKISILRENGVSEVLWPNPGSILSKAYDINNDGYMDIISLVAQGDEAIISFVQQEDNTFKAEYLMRYPPNYGSSWFEMIDFDNDGDLDLITAHGDNADKTYTQKPYHGVRISINDGFGNFKESFFYQLDGATRIVAEDFDKDNDVDIAVVSTFPDYENYPEMAFLYLNNLGNYNFEENIISDVDLGRWFLLDKGDIDNDGDIDIFLSSFTYTFSPVPDSFKKKWNDSNVDMIFLENNLKNSQN